MFSPKIDDRISFVYQPLGLLCLIGYKGITLLGTNSRGISEVGYPGVEVMAPGYTERRTEVHRQYRPMFDSRLGRLTVDWLARWRFAADRTSCCMLRRVSMPTSYKHLQQTC